VQSVEMQTRAAVLGPVLFIVSSTTVREYAG